MSTLNLSLEKHKQYDRLDCGQVIGESYELVIVIGNRRFSSAREFGTPERAEAERLKIVDAIKNADVEAMR